MDWAAMWDNIQWGTAGEWVGGVGALVPAVLWFFERRDRKAAELELEQRREQERVRQRQAQVRLVHFREATNESPEIPREFRRWLVTNDSSAPLRGVILNARFDLPGHSEAWIGVRSRESGPLGAGQSRPFVVDTSLYGRVQDVRLNLIDADDVEWSIRSDTSFFEVAERG